jgi:hypothetical protein
MVEQHPDGRCRLMRQQHDQHHGRPNDHHASPNDHHAGPNDHHAGPNDHHAGPNGTHGDRKYIDELPAIHHRTIGPASIL